MSDTPRTNLPVDGNNIVEGQLRPVIAKEIPPAHPSAEITQGMTPAKYVEASLTLHGAQYKKKGPPGWVRWIGDGALSVFPINRVSCSIGLTSGLFLGATAAKVLSGYDLNGVAAAKDSLPTFLQKLHGKIKYDPKAMDAKNRWVGYGLLGIYALGGFLGIKTGTWFAYRNMYKKNRNPQYLEDYIARVSQHHGDMWSWLASFGGVFGSSSGNPLLPIPGFNYGISLAFRATDMKDENLMLPGLGHVLSGSSTTLRYGVREGLDQFCHYALYNPAKNPTELEFLAFTILGQAFGKSLEAKHIQKFVGEMHTIRDKYWQEGGIPKEKQKAALEEMHARFTGKGFEELLDNIGLDAMKIDFLSLKGMVGKMSNVVMKNAVLKEQNEFRAKLAARREERSPKKETTSPEITEADISAAKSFATPELKKPSSNSLPRPGSHQERAAIPTEAAATALRA